MRLPVLPTSESRPDEQDLLRLFLRTQLHWGQILGEETTFDIGTAIVNRELSERAEANFVIQAALADGQSVAEAVGAVERHFAEHDSRCGQWIMNIGSPPEQVRPLVEYLQEHGYHPQPLSVMRLAGVPRQIAEVDGLKIIPSRASYRHFRQLAETAADEAGDAQIAELFLLHLDDPNWDSILALDGSEPVAMVGVLSVGDIGRIDQLYVHPRRRRRGLGRTMMSRALEICARSVFRHVMAAYGPNRPEAAKLLQSMGFVKMGEIPLYIADGFLLQFGGGNR